MVLPTASSIARLPKAVNPNYANINLMPERDAHGRFVKAGQITTKTSVSAPQVSPVPEFEKPLLQVTVTNPLKKILYWLDQIRKKQTTTFAIKLSIPLIALPVIIFAAFQIGRGSVVLPFIKWNSPTPAATIKPSPSPTPQVPYSRSGILKVAKTGNQIKYVLALKNGENVLLQVPTTIDLAKYQNKQVLITGYYNRQANVITLTEIAKIELFNETTLASPTPTPTPESTKSAN